MQITVVEPCIQNEIVEIISDNIRDKILGEIKRLNITLFSVMMLLMCEIKNRLALS